MNKKTITIIGIIILIIIVAVVLYLLFSQKGTIIPISGDAEAACVDSGGAVISSSCCALSDDFPNTCMIGACGCSPDNSKETKTCSCPENYCFDGTGCKSVEIPVEEPLTE